MTDDEAREEALIHIAAQMIEMPAVLRGLPNSETLFAYAVFMRLAAIPREKHWTDEKNCHQHWMEEFLPAALNECIDRELSLYPLPR